MKPKNPQSQKKSLLIHPNKVKSELELSQMLYVILIFTDQMDVIQKENSHVFLDTKRQVLLKALVKELLKLLLVILSSHVIHQNVMKKSVFIANTKNRIFVQKFDQLKATVLCLTEHQDSGPNKARQSSILWVAQHLLNIQSSLKYQQQK